MTTLEMITKLIENPELKAKRTKDLLIYDKVDSRFRYYPSRLPYIPCMTDDWEIIYPEPKEVPVLEAMKAFSYEGKTIYCILGEDRHEYIGSEGKYCLTDDNEDVISVEEILKGKWYVGAEHDFM